MKMRNKLKIVFLFFIITVVSLGCIESQKLPIPNETKTVTPEPTPEQKLPAYNETKPLRINGTFETWSRGYWSNFSYKQTYFRVITNYSEWTAFLAEQGYITLVTGQGPPMLEGELFPGSNKMPKTIISADFNDHFIIAAMMGYRGIIGPRIEIKNITKINNLVNITIHMYEPKVGPDMHTAPYHIVIVKRELLPAGNSTFVFMDTEGKKLGKLEVRKSEQITIEKAKTLAIYKVYPRWDEMNKTIYKNIVLDVDRDLSGNYIVHVCDLNVECTCRPNEGYWIKVTEDGSSVFIQRANACHYG